jgi:putative sigma-54 modulation protein
MEVQVHSIHFSVDRKLVHFIQEKMEKLDLFFGNIISCDIFMKVNKNQVKQNKLVELKINVPGKILIVKKQCKSFEEAVDLSVQALKNKGIKQKRKVA